MKKKEITYTGLVKVMMAKARKESSASGKPFDTKSAFSSAAARWKHVKDNSDAEFSQGRTVPGANRSFKKKKQKGGSEGSSREFKTCNKLAEDLLNKVDMCDDCKLKIEKFLYKPSSSGKGTRRKA